MDGAPLTGRDATEAIGVYARLAAAGARFHAGTVARASRTAQGRTLIHRAIDTALRPSAARTSRHGRSSRAWPATRRARLAAATGSPGRPGELERGTPRG